MDCTGLSWDKDDVVWGDGSKVTAQGPKEWEMSIPGDHPDSPGHGTKQPAIVATLALLGAELGQRPAA